MVRLASSLQLCLMFLRILKLPERLSRWNFGSCLKRCEQAG